jgi:hypothetical protein
VLTNSDIGADDLGFHMLDPTFPLEEIQTVAKVDAAVLEAHTGSYVLIPGVEIAVAREGDGLTIQVTGQPAYSLFAASETEFFMKVVPIKIVFERDDAGNTTTLVLHQGGAEQRAQRKDPSE